MKNGYMAHNLTEEAKEKLLSIFPPKFPIVVAHHVTLDFNVPASSEIPEKAEIKVIGYSSNKNIECVVVEVNGNSKRPSDGKLFHITLSHTKDAKPVQSNDLLIEQGFDEVSPFLLDTVPTFNSF